MRGQLLVLCYKTRRTGGNAVVKPETGFPQDRWSKDCLLKFVKIFFFAGSSQRLVMPMTKFVRER